MQQPLEARNDFLSRLVGEFIIRLGTGDISLRGMILNVVRDAETYERRRLEAENPKVDRQPSDQVIPAKLTNVTVDTSDKAVYVFTKGCAPNVELVFRGEELIDVKLIKA